MTKEKKKPGDYDPGAEWMAEGGQRLLVESEHCTGMVIVSRQGEREKWRPIEGFPGLAPYVTLTHEALAAVAKRTG